jgi:hypothetical protein
MGANGIQFAASISLQMLPPIAIPVIMTSTGLYTAGVVGNQDQRMAITFNCPHCKKKYKLADSMTGRRVTCAEAKCRKQFVVPAPVRTALAAPIPNADEFAAAALSESAAPAPAKTEAKREAEPIKVKCPHCDFGNTFEARMAGKNAPCQNDDCRKIIKVPLLEKAEAKDWRKVGKSAPSMARVDTEPGMEGAWGVAQQTAVSREALKEAEAIGGPEEEEGPNWRKRIIRIAIGLLVVGLVGYGIFYGVRRWNRGQERRTMEDALKLAIKPEESKLTSEQAGLIFLFAAEQAEHQKRWTDAKEKLDQARGRIKNNSLTPSTPEQSLALLDVALHIADLAGTKEELQNEQRLDWQKAKLDEAMRQTVQLLPQDGSDEVHDLHTVVFRELVRKMAARGQFDACILIANQNCPNDRSEVLAVMGLEMLSQGQRDRAEKLAKDADAGNAAQAPSLIALWLAIGSPDSDKAKEGLARAQAIAPEPTKAQSLTPVQRIGWAAGLARQGKLEKAREILADKGGSADERFRAKVAVAEAVMATQPSDTTELQACADQLEREFKKEPAPMWILWRLVQLSLKAGRADLAKLFLDKISDPSLKAEAQLVFLRADLKTAAAKKETIDYSRAKEVGDPDKLTQGWAWMEIARHNARIRGDSKERSEVRGWPSDRDRWKAFGYAGVALAGYQEEN